MTGRGLLLSRRLASDWPFSVQPSQALVSASSWQRKARRARRAIGSVV